MAYVLFVIGSTIEYLSLFVFMLTLFRFNVKRRIYYVVLASFLMSQISYFTRLDPDIGSMSTYLQLVLSIIVLRILFLVPWVYSAIMNIASIVYGFALQGIVLLLIWGAFDIPLDSVKDDAWMTVATQVLSAVLFLATSRIIFVYNLGFNYIPISYREYAPVTRTSAILMAVTGFCVAAAGLTTFLLRNDFQDYVIVASAIFIATLPIFLYLSFRKDEEDVR